MDDSSRRTPGLLTIEIGQREGGKNKVIDDDIDLPVSRRMADRTMICQKSLMALSLSLCYLLLSFSLLHFDFGFEKVVESFVLLPKKTIRVVRVDVVIETFSNSAG